MLVFGDAAESVDSGELLATLRVMALSVDARSARQNLTELFLDAAKLGQGLIDAEFETAGCDAPSPLRDAATDLVMSAARAFVGNGDRGGIAAAIDMLERQAIPERVFCKRPEGYAFYALYPEAYVAAARGLSPGGVRVIGIRSIGLGLAALVAAASHSSAPLSVRPVGPHFARELRLRAAYLDPASAGPNSSFAVVDEGPGLSGSSFAAVVGVLIAAEVSEKQIHLLPSHSGMPGHAASTETRALWQRLPRHVVTFDDLFLAESSPEPRLDTWFSDLTGPATAPLREISGGAWRDLLPAGTARPPAHLQQERRKFVLTTAKGRFLLKFAGLGQYGRSAFERGRILSEAGFVPEILAFRHGFLLQKWEEARSNDGSAVSRAALLEHVGDYLACRALRLRGGNGVGASLDELAAMLRQNGVEALGPEAIKPLERFCALRPAAEADRIASDNRMHAWEWLQLNDGRLLKADAIDHCAAHDLIGCQPVGWDIVGAAIELGLSGDEQAELADRIERATGEAINRRLLDFLTPCYLAFQLGYYSMAAAALAGVPDEAARLERRSAFYSHKLAEKLAAVL